MKASNKNLIITIAIFIIIAVTAITVYLVWNSNNNPNNSEPVFENATMGIMPGIDIQARKKELQEKLDNSMIAFSINTSPVFIDGLSEGNLLIENPENNAKLLTVEIQLQDTQDVIYNSKYIKPGSYLENVKLDKVLEKGTYNATAYFNAYDEDTLEFIGKTGANIMITVQN